MKTYVYVLNRLDKTVFVVFSNWQYCWTRKVLTIRHARRSWHIYTYIHLHTRRVLFTACPSASKCEENNILLWSLRQVIIGNFAVISDLIKSFFEPGMIGLLTATATLGQASLMKRIRFVDLLVERIILGIAWRLASSANEILGRVQAIYALFTR